MAKSAVKPIFPPLPHPSFFAPKSPFFPLFPVSNPISGDFSRDRARFLPREVHFFIVLPRFGADFGRFFEEYFAFLPPLTAFSIHAPPPSSLPPHFLSHSSPLFHLPSPINTRTCAPSRITCVRVHPHTPTRQEVFVYCLHRFTHLSQSTGHQRVRGEGEREKAFTKHTTIS